MKSVRNLVSNLLKDNRPGRWTEPPAPTKEEIAARIKDAERVPRPPTHQTTSSPVRVYRKDHIDVPLPAQPPSVLHTTESGPTEALDPNCQHKPSYKDGLKFCWLCGGAYPLDERPPSPWGQKFKKK